MTVYEKIKRLCESAGFSISSIGEKIPNLKINKASVTGWKNGSKPRPDKLKIIADYFNVSVEYLADEQESRTVATKEPPVTDFYAKVSALCRERGISVTEFAKQINMGQSNVTTWKAGAQPHSKTLKAAAHFFGVPVAYFYGDTAPEPSHALADTPLAALGDIEREIIAICGKLDMKRKNALLTRAYELLDGKQE